MNNSAVRSSVRTARLSDLQPLQAAPAAPRAWPSPIGSKTDEMPSKVLDMPRLPKGEVVKLPVVLNARGSDYARIWIVNLLLTVLTLGLYLPWARVRTQRYFLRRTLVAGSALDYHAPPSSHWLRHGLVLSLVAGVVGAGLGSPLAGLLAFSMALLVAPLAVHNSLTHRMSHTSWAGRRLSFDGQFAAVYAALLMPLLGVVAAAWLTLAGLTFHHPMWWIALGFVIAVWLLGVPLFLWTYFQYRQERVRLGPLRLSWKASPLAVVMLWARTGTWSVLVSALVMGLGAVALGALLWWQGRAQGAWLWGMVSFLSALVLVAVKPYLEARLQNLVWNKTGNRVMRFRSRLSVQGYVLLQLRHALLLLLTLGMYWPWAVVASRRMRTESLAVWARVDTEVLKARWATFASTRAGSSAKRRASA